MGGGCPQDGEGLRDVFFDPSYGGASGTNGYVSSFTGLDSTNAVTGYSRSAASGGSMRIDLVTVSVVPEPTTCTLLGTSALIGGAIAWRRRRRRRRRHGDAC